MPNLSEDEIDDVLYLARSNEVDELSGLVKELAAHHACSAADILSAAIDPETQNTALHYAGANGHVGIITLLATLTPSSQLPHLNGLNSSGNTPLHWAALNGHLPFVQALIKQGADATVINAAGHDAIFEAELNGKNEVVDWLLEKAVGLEQGVSGNTDEQGSNGGTGVDEVSDEVERMNMNSASEGGLG